MSFYVSITYKRMIFIYNFYLLVKYAYIIYHGKLLAEITSVSIRCEKFRWLPANNFDRFSPIGGEMKSDPTVIY